MSLDCMAAIFMRFVMFCYPRFVYEKEMSLYSITVYALQNAFITTNGYAAFGRHIHYRILLMDFLDQSWGHQPPNVAWSRAITISHQTKVS